MNGIQLESLDITKGCVDGHGDTRYIRLTQNVPDGYVFDLQSDLLQLDWYDPVV